MVFSRCQCAFVTAKRQLECEDRLAWRSREVDIYVDCSKFGITLIISFVPSLFTTAMVFTQLPWLLALVAPRLVRPLTSVHGCITRNAAASLPVQPMFNDAAHPVNIGTRGHAWWHRRDWYNSR